MNNHNLQVIFFLSLTIIYQIICQFGHPICFHPLICIFLGPTPECSFTHIISLHLSLCLMTFCCSRILPSKGSFEINYFVWSAMHFA